MLNSNNIKNMNSSNTSGTGGMSEIRAEAAKFIDPRAIIEKLEMLAGSVVADFGCANGYFSLPVAEKIGEEGVVYCLDILPQCIETVESQAKTKGVTNIIAKRANIEKDGGSKLPDSSCDWVIVKNVLFMNNNKETILGEAKRVLKDDGKILVIEWNSDNYAMGPERELRIPKESLLDIVDKIGLILAKEIPVSDFHYGIVLAKLAKSV